MLRKRETFDYFVCECFCHPETIAIFSPPATDYITIKWFDISRSQFVSIVACVCVRFSTFVLSLLYFCFHLNFIFYPCTRSPFLAHVCRKGPKIHSQKIIRYIEMERLIYVTWQHAFTVHCSLYIYVLYNIIITIIIKENNKRMNCSDKKEKQHLRSTYSINYGSIGLRQCKLLCDNFYSFPKFEV